jgi:hypothetical protein
MPNVNKGGAVNKSRFIIFVVCSFGWWPFTSAFSQPPPIKITRVLWKDAVPQIAPNAEILLFIHGMDSRAEEADDITKALFAAMGTPQTPPSPNPDVAVLNQLLQKYQNCILEKYETQQDMVNRGLPSNDSGLLSTAGLEPVGVVQCLDGSQCSMTSRLNTLAALQAQANLGDPTNFMVKLESAIPTDCFQCAKHQEMHTKHVHCTMEAGGNNGFITGPKFEACQAGVDISAWAALIAQDIQQAFNSIANSYPTVPDVTGGASIATNHTTVHFASCPDPSSGCPEVCDHPDNFVNGQLTGDSIFDTVNGVKTQVYFEPNIPPGLLDTTPPPGTSISVPPGHNIGQNEGRLQSDLRTAASVADPRASLEIAAMGFAANNNITGNAFADLSVTGHRSFAAFKANLPNDAFCQSLVAKHPEINSALMVNGCEKALDRAYQVANFLRTGQRGDSPSLKSAKIRARAALGWIAVSGEDDSPHRPVNVPSSDFPQFDLDVPVSVAPAAPLTPGRLPVPLRPRIVTVHTRYTIAQSQLPGSGKNLVVISFDLPTSGYADNLDYNQISSLNDIGTPVSVADFQATGKTTLLDFIEAFILQFVNTLDQQVPIKSNIKAAIGGSLGGNMTFRLGRRTGVPWLPEFVVWSPASIWNSLGAGADITKHIAVRTAWQGAADASDNSPGTDHSADRSSFFATWDQAIVPVIIPMAQSDTWTSAYYQCKKSAIAGARLDRQETYDQHFLAWHWRLAAEQLLFSHQNINPTTNQPLYMSNVKPMLLGCGLEDAVAYNDICPATQSTAALMTVTPGKALFLDKTGHSLDNERRSFWAQQIIQFLGL